MFYEMCLLHYDGFGRMKNQNTCIMFAEVLSLECDALMQYDMLFGGGLHCLSRNKKYVLNMPS